jgi:hypothetical protein
LWLADARGVVSGGQRVNAAGREAELLGGLAGIERVLPEGVEDVADK